MPETLCENCRTRPSTVGCVLCRRNLCNECFDKHILEVTADMDEGFVGMAQPTKLQAQ